MLVRSGTSKISGKSVTTLSVSIGLFHGDEVVAPRRDRGARRDPVEPEQPLAVVRAPARHDQRPRHHLPLLVHHIQPGLGREYRTRIRHQGEDRHLTLLPVRLAQPSDYAGRLPSTPAFFRSERTVSVGSAPLASHASACSASTLMSAGLV